MARNALGLQLDFGKAARLSWPGSVWNCLWGHALKRSGINRKSRVLYSSPGFLSSATWPSLPKKHYNGLFDQSINRISYNCCKTPCQAVILNTERHRKVGAAAMSL